MYVNKFPNKDEIDMNSSNAMPIFSKNFSENPYWWDDISSPNLESKVLPKEVDVVIVGAGVTGLNAALELVKGGRSVAVLDSEYPGYGASTRNIGFLGRFLKKSFTELTDKYGTEKAVAYYSELYEALNVSMREVIETEQIDCDFHISGRVAVARSQAQFNGLVKEFELRQKHLNEPIEILDKAALQREMKCSNIFYGGVLIPDLAVIHPGKYHMGLVDRAIKYGVGIYANNRVENIGTRDNDGKFQITTQSGSLRASEVIVATNGYTGSELKWFSRRLVPFQGFVIATEELPADTVSSLLPNNRTYSDSDFDTMAVRQSPDGRRIILSGRTGKSMPMRNKAKLLRDDLISIFPQLKNVKISYAWSGFCAAPIDTSPKIGQRADGVRYVTGLTFMGMPQGTYFGRKIAWQILGKPEGKTVFTNEPFRRLPLYNGKPWFVSPVMSLMGMKDRITNRAGSSKSE